MRRLSVGIAAVAARWPAVLAQSSTTTTNYLTVDDFMGWYLGPGAPQAMMAGGNYYITSGQWARGCDGPSGCEMATACKDQTISYDGGDLYTCTSGMSCVSITIYATSPTGMPAATNIVCAINWSAYTLYRTLSVSSTTSSSTTSTSTSIITTPPPTTTPTSSAPATTSKAASSSSGSNDSWIAGAVIGPIAAVALIGAAFWFGRRAARKRGLRGTPVPPGPPTSPPSNMPSPGYGPGGPSSADPYPPYGGGGVPHYAPYADAAHGQYQQQPGYPKLYDDPLAGRGGVGGGTPPVMMEHLARFQQPAYAEMPTGSPNRYSELPSGEWRSG